MKGFRFFNAVLFLSFGVITSPLIALADERVNTTSETLLARIQVEDFINDYYWELATEAGGGVSGFWAKDAVFDVNGDVFNGIEAIEEVYSRGLGPGGKLVFQMDIPRIRINGNTALVDIIYTGILNTDPNLAPSFHEQGHDHMEISNTNGEWKIIKRTLRSFSLAQTSEE